MKKLFLIASLGVLSFGVYAQAQEEKKESNKPASPEMSALQTAAGLAKYGYANYSATALVEAAKIFAETKTQSMDATAERGKTETVSDKDNAVTFKPSQLLADAKKYADKDEVVLAYISKVEKEMGAGATRGAVGGPKGQEDRVYGKTFVGYRVKFWANELAEVCVSGDGDTDLDLYIYDENDHLIASDTDYTDDCVCRWIPAWTGTFYVKVVNRGAVYNNFAIWTN